MEKRLKGIFESSTRELQETNRKLQRQITTISEDFESKLHGMKKGAKLGKKANGVKVVKESSEEKKKNKRKISEVFSPKKKKETSPPKVNKNPAIIKDSFSEFSISEETPPEEEEEEEEVK